jgi:hypothetical protein
MTRSKPVRLLVFGILNLVVGTLWLLSALCCGAFAGGMLALAQSAQQPGAPQDQQEAMGVFKAFTDNIPGLAVAVGIYITCQILLSLMQLISGFGLLWVQNWARWLCAVWAVLAIAFVVVSLAYQVAVVTPAMPEALKDMQKWAEKLEEKHRQKGMPPPVRQQQFNNAAGTGNPFVDNAMIFVWGAFFIAYGLVTFIFMVLPGTSRAIARYHGKSDGQEHDRGDDFYDAEFERRRREQPPPGGGEPGQPPR